MAIFNLLTFPNVCRACLQPLPPDQMASLDEHRSLFDGTIDKFLQEITIKVPDMVQPYLPSAICYACLGVMELHYKYREKMRCLHQFIVALVHVKLGDKSQMKQLFDTHLDQLGILFRDLDICNTDIPRVEDLLEEYDQYAIASMHIEDQPYKYEIIDENYTSTVKEEECNESDTSLFVVLCNDETESAVSQPLPRDSDFEEYAVFSADEQISDLENQREEKAILSLETKTDGKHQHNQSQLDVSGTNESSDEKVGTDDSNCAKGELENPAVKRRKTRATRYQLNAKIEQLLCTQCSYKTYYAVAYELHLNKHKANEGKTGHLCSHPYCMMLFDTKEELKRHKIENTPHSYVCELCGTVLKHRASYDVHLERHVGITHFQCPYCSSTFFTHTETIAHVATIHLSEDREKCQQCGAMFKSRKLLNQHLESHSTERNYHCKECQTSFKSQHQLNRHIKTVHQNVRFNCDHCDASYGRRDKLRMHMEKFHQIQSFFVCTICVRSLPTNEALQEHMDRHSNPKYLECGTCLLVCLTPETFEKHICITYQDDYVCCGRDFKNHFLYNKHMARGHGIKVNARVRPDTSVPIGGKARRFRRPRCSVTT
ncbi:zinc finger protein draculin-like [Anopheles ziemanni]|uniref:zinc finger protein draculin-like n=1 Tax=Anopheles coustani TaxID=139045 RepID=UPI00265A09A6|nr:zinc finger protein draculin-like [Anopheles coustani]XP_058178462.1 zinc finger protein draculin-like [Anopheles ziemanni]